MGLLRRENVVEVGGARWVLRPVTYEERIALFGGMTQEGAADLGQTVRRSYEMVAAMVLRVTGLGDEDGTEVAWPAEHAARVDLLNRLEPADFKALQDAAARLVFLTPSAEGNSAGPPTPRPTRGPTRGTGATSTA